MNRTSIGWTIFISCVGTMAGLMAVDIGTLQSWHDAAKPAFVGLQLAHISVVIAAFVGGKIIPADRDPMERTRVSDQKIAELNNQQKG